MTLNLRMSLETEARLKERAKKLGVEVERLVVAAVEATLATENNGASTSSGTSPEQWVAAWREWAASHPIRSGVHLDDSRESIYSGRGE